MLLSLHNCCDYMAACILLCYTFIISSLSLYFHLNYLYYVFLTSLQSTLVSIVGLGAQTVI